MYDDPSLKLDIAKLISWVECETTTKEGYAINNLIDIIEQEGRQIGAVVKRWQGGPDCGDVLLLAPLGHDPSISILLHGHIDTVHPRGSLTGTLKPRFEDGRLYGPGVYDMKAGVLMAFLEFKRSLLYPNEYSRPLAVMIVPDEEHGSVFSRSITQEIARTYRAAFVFEPGGENFGVVCGRKGYGEYLLHTYGKAAHAGMRPHDGQSAIVEMCRHILVLEELTDDIRGVSCNVGLVSGGTFTNVIPERAMARIDLRFRDQAGWEYLKARVEGLSAINPAVRLELDFVLQMPPLTLQSTTVMLDAVRSAGRQLGLDVNAEVNGGASDANIIAEVGVPVLDGMGPEGGGAHTRFEYVHVESYHKKATLVRTLLTGNFIR